MLSTGFISGPQDQLNEQERSQVEAAMQQMAPVKLEPVTAEDWDDAVASLNLDDENKQQLLSVLVKPDPEPEPESKPRSELTLEDGPRHTDVADALGLGRPGWRCRRRDQRWLPGNP